MTYFSRKGAVMGAVAFADESMRASADPPMYLIAATIVPENTDLSALEAVLPKGAKKLHWRKLGKRDQRIALSKIAELSSKSTIAVAIPTDPHKQRRARRKALEKLLPLLEESGIHEIIMESRFPALDAEDMELFRSLIKKKVISTIRLTFADPAIEHRLWLPDQILGAYAENRVDCENHHPWINEWAKISPSVYVIELTP